MMTRTMIKMGWVLGVFALIVMSPPSWAKLSLAANARAQDPALTITAIYTFLPNHRQQAQKIFKRLKTKTRQEPGNLSYELYRNRDPDKMNQLIVISTWTSEKTYAGHRKQTYFKRAYDHYDVLLAGKPQIEWLRLIKTPWVLESE